MQIKTLLGLSRMTPAPTPIPDTVCFHVEQTRCRGNQGWWLLLQLSQGDKISSSYLLPGRPPGLKITLKMCFRSPELKLIAELPGGLKNGVEQLWFNAVA